MSATTPSLTGSFERIYEQEVGYVLETLRRLGAHAADVPDLAHDVFLVVHQRLGTYDTSRPIRPWLFGIAYRVFSDFRRSARVRREVAEPVTEAVDTANTVTLEERLAHEQDRRLVHEALASLDEELRAVFVLHELDEVSIPDASEALGVPLNTLYSRLRTARRKFSEAARRQLLRRGDS